jgi:hypothetical protein
MRSAVIGILVTDCCGDAGYVNWIIWNDKG